MKGLASDLDGTLIFQNAFLPDDLKAIQQFQKEGHLFGLCSGRPVGSVLTVMPSSIQPDFYIAVSGAIILDKNKNVLQASILEYKLVSEIYHRYKDKAKFIVQTTNPQIIYATTMEFPGLTLFQDISELKDQQILGISLINISEEDANTYASYINENYKDIEGFQNRDSVDCVKRGVSKGEACKFVKEKLHIDQMAAIGDSYNDIPMLEVADVSFTFNSSPIDIQKMVTYSVDSVAKAINLLL